MLGNGAEEGSNVPVLVGFEYSIPEISSLSRDKVGTNISGTQTTIRGLDFAGSVTVEIGGRQATVVYSNSTAIGIEIPVSPTPGAVDVKVTNGNGQFVILHNGFTYETPSPRVVNGVAFGEEAGKKIMTITGTGLVGAEDPTEFQQAMIPPFKSFVSLNGVALDFCTHGTGFTQADLEGYNVPGSTDDPTCYYLFNSSVQPVITPTAAKIWLVDSFDITAPGSVIVNGSAPFLFNQPGGGESDDDATVVVNGQSLANTPEIAKRSTFSGTAEPGAQVTVTVHSDPVSCTGIADAQGRWSCTLPTDLVPGQHTVYVHVVNPDSTTIDLGPYSVTVAGDSPTTLSAPNTGMQRIRIFSSPQVLLVFGGAILSLGVLIYALYRRVNDLKS
ncbi:hypothetical protein I8H89_05050 [Candidatus Saccharibacteria bacterium]|nr:hypothetical protein [Candidatus Saccharibacteria bacterium]